jgi:hypothetical protein
MSDNKIARLDHVAKLRDNHFALVTLTDLIADSKNHGGLYRLLLTIANQ